MRTCHICFAMWLVAVAGISSAQLPSEALLIINASSPSAVTVAEHYASLRGFPPERMLYLKPDPAFFLEEDGAQLWSVWEMSAREVLIGPLKEKLDALDDDVPTALLFSPDWPTRIKLKGRPSISLTAFAGCLGEVPEGDIKHGKLISPWYTHPPDQREGKATLNRYPAQNLSEARPLPAAMLGVRYEPLDTEAITKALGRAVKADHTRPVGSVVIVTNADVRTKARFDQFAPAAQALETASVPVLLDTASAALPDKVLGVMTGAAGVNTAPYKDRLVPGAFAEHLTSFAATFDTPGQTKLTEWIDVGAAGSVGTVTEPFAIWTKFPRAAVFERYLSGQTLLESLTQSIASPYQTLIVGDPLCRPWGRKLAPLRLHTHWQKGQLTVRAEAGYDPARTDHHLFVNGSRIPGNGPEWTLSQDSLGDKDTIDLLLHARYNWAPPETGWIQQTIQRPADTPNPQQKK